MAAISTVIFCVFLPLTITNALDPYELNEFINSEFTNKAFNGSWVDDQTLMYSYDSNIYFFYPENKTSMLFFNRTVLSDFSSYSLSLSPDQQYFLVKYNTTSIFRHSTVAQYSIIDIETGTLYYVADSNFLSYATWNTNSNGLAYVLDNNIYYISSPEEVDNPRQITNDGVEGVIYNGVPDWVYEEEVLSSGSAMWFSPDGNKLVFAFFNDSDVMEFTYYLYGTPGSLEDQYPENVTLRYPKAGTTNPTVFLKYVDLSNNSSQVVTLDIIPTDIVTEEYVIYTVGWANNDDVVAIIKNRVQNKAAVSRCTASENTCYVITVYEQENGWLDLKKPVWNLDGTQYLMILAQPEGDDTWQHIVLTNVLNNSTLRLTNGLRAVLSISGWDTTRNLVYYLGTTEENASERHLYSVNTETLQNYCLTCNFEYPEGNCSYATASFSMSFSYYAKVCQSGPNYAVIQSVDNSSDTYLWLDNLLIREQLAEKLQPTIKFLSVPLESGYTANVKLFLPPDLDESVDSVSYPLIVYV